MSKSPKPPTLTDVARLAGVSVPTASRALNGGVRGVASGSSDVRRRVHDAARALGYAPNAAAQATKEGRARTVALLVGDIEDFRSVATITGVMRAAEGRGVPVTVRATMGDPLRELELLTTLRGERHRAVILATGRTADAQRERAVATQLRVLEEQGARVVIVGDSELDFPSVTVDNRESARIFAGCLVEAGLRRFAVLSGPQGEIVARDRAEGFVAGLAEHGIEVPPDDIVSRSFSRDGGYSAVQALEGRLDRFDVLAAMSGAMAVGAIARLHERGLDVPGEIEVTGFDHVPMLADVLPRYSTVEVSPEAVGEAALSLALGEADPLHGSRIAVPATPIVRGVRVSRQ
ncbi:MAG TPA: LacI family DNA-binding transcriptional regulator [Arachnia sp.]|nr:LacI family DNA-binding transcriptional regulator [Arachnia sp.]HMT86797.1 LacI family DNA-binding transcriptional regulator [Arachnia sp.]